MVPRRSFPLRDPRHIVLCGIIGKGDPIHRRRFGLTRCEGKSARAANKHHKPPYSLPNPFNDGLLPMYD
jgi:hypothetical protein